MPDDLFEEESETKKGKKSSEEKIDVFADDDVIDKSPEDEEAEVFADDEAAEAVSGDEDAWIPLDDEELEISPDESSEGEEISDEELRELEKKYGVDDEDVEIDIDGELKTSPQDEEGEVFADDEAAEAASDDEGAWIPLDDEELSISPDDEKTDEPLGGDEISDEELRELEKKYGVDDEDVGLDIDSELGMSSQDEEVEAPPWEEGVEIPVHAATGSPKRKKTFMIVGILVLVALVVAVAYLFLQSKHMFVKEEFKPDDEKPLFVTKKTETIPTKEAGPEVVPEKKAAPEPTAMKVNTAPAISGAPVTSVKEGTLYSFIPNASDIDPGDKLTFFIANQPVWTSFDINTGALSGTPRSEDVGIYENIVILVSDGAATASLPGFFITVTGVAPILAEEKKAQQETAALETESEKKKELKALPEEKFVLKEPPEEKKALKAPPEVKKEIVKEIEAGQYTPPDLTDLIKQSEFQDAALEYHEEVKQFPNAYALKLEVVCVGKSVQTAFGQGNYDRRMFILPKEINGKGCFVVFWGLYTTKNDAIKALSSIPAFFSSQATKPELVLIKQYL
jgi:hypothetical protein